MSFLTSIYAFDYRPLNNGLVANQGRLVWQDDRTKATYTVPDGFVSNLMSYPWWSGWLFNKFDATGRPSMLHDYLAAEDIGTKLWRDDQYNLALKADGISRSRRIVIYLGLSGVRGPSGKPKP